MSDVKDKHSVLVMTPDREFASQFLALCRQHGQHTRVSACVSVSATMMLTSHIEPCMLLADTCYGEPVLRQLIRELKYENPYLVVILVGKQGAELTQLTTQVRANGSTSRDHADCIRLLRLLSSRPVNQGSGLTRPFIPWTMPPLQPRQVYS